MPSEASDGLARVQGESRISANTWRGWCSRLGMDPNDVVELWDEVCHPLMVASQSAPDIAFIMSLRAARSALYIEDFKDEVPAILITANLLDALQDSRLSGAKGKSAILKLYQRASASQGEYTSPEFSGQLAVDLCTAILLAKIMPGDNVTLSRLARLLLEGKADLDGLAPLALKTAASESFADQVRACLAARQALSEAVRETVANGESGDGEEEDDDDLPEAEGDEEAEEEEEEEEDDDEGEEDEEDDEGDGTNEAGVDAFLSCFRDVMEAIYQTEASELGFTQDSNQVLATRLGAVSQFHPLRSRIPSMEEAQKLGRGAGGDDSGRQRALDRARSSGKSSGPRPVMTARPTRSGNGGPKPSGGGGMLAPPASSGSTGAPKSSAVIKAGGGGGASPTGGAPAKPAGGAPSPGAGASSSETAAVEVDDAPEDAVPSEADVAVDEGARIVVGKVHSEELSEIVNRIGQLLGMLEQLEPRVWQVFTEPDVELEDPRALAEDLMKEGSGAQQAYEAVKIVAQQQGLNTILSLPVDRRLNERRFDLEAAAFINTINNTRRGFETDSRQLIPLPKMLDNAAGALVRLVALRTTLRLAREANGDLPVETVTQQCDEILSDVTYMASRDITEPARERADADVAALAKLLAAALLVDRLVEETVAYASVLEEEGYTESTESVSEALAASPLQFEGVEATGGPGKKIPDKHTDPTKLGEVFDAVRDYVFGKVWECLSPLHQPDETLERLDEELRRSLKGSIRMEPRRERHHKNTKVPLAVVSLEALSGSPELAHLFLRVTVDGKLLYIEDFEDGTYIDVFERRKNTKRTMHARARDRAQDDGSGELQMGANYLYTIGRTNAPFGRTQDEVLKGCVLNEKDEPVIYPIF